jgi:digeranylgeranylglycerophospholipid reductase
VGKRTFELLNMEVKGEWVSNEYDSILLGQVGGGGGLIRTGRTRGYLLNRKRFDYDLAMMAKAEGAETLFGAAATGVEIKDDVVVTTATGIFKSRMVIACDGPQSRVANSLGLGRPKCYFTIQHELEGGCDLKHTLQILFYPEIGFETYCWIFPKKDSLNVGLTSKGLYGIKEKLEKFIAASGLSSRKVLEVNAGLLPGQNRLKRISADRLLVAGDAAGHANPLTGGGIPAALYDGLLAGEVALKALRAGAPDAGSLGEYQRRWEKGPFKTAWEAGFKVKGEIDTKLGSEALKGVFSKIGLETITGREGIIERFAGKGFTLREVRLLYRLTTSIFDKVIDYAM